ncbi:GntR family transcriptional regulator [Vibrio sinensis]|uniref:GntR family transcriptional regulator n=2 Tax=Vibrio sinensis TaxID=2302434 RepID=A0A3A6Q4S0_9VIBR|nr:GntR family transcriptional regulator [Vibrio sinensis]
MIRNPAYEVGDCLPSEAELCREFNVSRMTIRKALNVLTTYGMIERIHGKGTFITNKEFRHQSNNPQSFPRSENNKPQKLESEVTKFSLISAPLSIAKILNVKENSRIYFCTRIRRLNNQAIQIEESYFPTCLFPDITLSHLEKSKFDYVKNHTNIKIKGSKEIFKPMIPNKEQQEIFNLKKADPLIQITSINESEDGLIFDVSFILVNTQIYELGYYFSREQSW